MEAAVRRVGQVACGVRGHEMLRHYERERVMLECGRCGHASKGWDVAERRRRSCATPATLAATSSTPLKIATRRSA